jgi:catabolite regulation protein CreA
MNLKFDNICGYLRQYKKNMLDYNRLNLTEEVVNSSISIYQERYHLSLF